VTISCSIRRWSLCALFLERQELADRQLAEYQHVVVAGAVEVGGMLQVGRVLQVQVVQTDPDRR